MEIGDHSWDRSLPIDAFFRVVAVGDEPRQDPAHIVEGLAAPGTSSAIPLKTIARSPHFRKRLTGDELPIR